MESAYQMSTLCVYYVEYGRLLASINNNLKPIYSQKYGINIMYP